ncbi:hypothetical protein M514_02610, partial [Trichuris suis]
MQKYLYDTEMNNLCALHFGGPLRKNHPENREYIRYGDEQLVQSALQSSAHQQRTGKDADGPHNGKGLMQEREKGPLTLL